MTKEISSLLGLGFELCRVEPDDGLPCSFHKIQEDEDNEAPVRCSDTPYVYLSLTQQDGEITMCRKHYAQLMVDMMGGFDIFDVEDSDLPTSGNHMVNKEGSMVTKNAFLEIFRRVKAEKLGADQ
jgi:hypothetical protein